jgi:geranylgeranylglycerol-phosphate geranylgeranyltransferase
MTVPETPEVTSEGNRIISPDGDSPLRRRVAGRVGTLLVVTRIRSCLAGGAATGIGCYLGNGSLVVAPARSVAAAMSIVAAIAFANVVNDIADVNVDAIGKPDRPLPAGRLSLPTARVLAAGTAIAAMAFTVPLGAAMAGWMAVLLAVSFLYSARLKGTILVGNVLVAACASSPLTFGAAAVGRINTPVWIATALAFEFMLSYEVLKTVADRTGDAAAGLRTVATATRSRSSVWIFVGIVVVLTATVLAATTVTSHPIGFLGVAVPVFVVPCWYVVYRLRAVLGDEQVWDLMRLMRRAWLLGTFALLVLR